MGQRITNAYLEEMFESLSNAARNRGVDVSGWSFGQHYGRLYQIRDSGREHGQIISNQWSTKREAWEGMYSMLQGLMLIPFYKVEA